MSVNNTSYYGIDSYFQSSNTTVATSSLNAGNTLLGGLSVAKNMYLGSSHSGTVDTSNAVTLSLPSYTFTDNSTTNTLSVFRGVSFGQLTLAATNTSITTTTAASLFIQGPVIAGTNETITNNYTLLLGSGNLGMSGTSSGIVSLTVPSSFTNYNFNLPSTSGTSGYFLTTQGNSSPMTWTGFSGTGNVVLTSNATLTSPTLVTPTLGVASATSLTSSGNVSGSTLTSTISTGTSPFTVSSTTLVSNLNSNYLNGFTFANPGAIGSSIPNSGSFTSLNLNGSTSGTISILASTGTYNFNLPTTIGTLGQVLTTSGNSSNPYTWSTVGTGSVTSVAISTPSIFTVSGSPITVSGTLAISYSGTPLPVLYGGSGTTTSTGSGNLVLSNSPTFTSPSLDNATAISISASGNLSGSTLTSTVSTGTSPLTITSTTVVSNLNSNFLNGNTFANPGPIGTSTSSTGSFTQLNLNGSTSGSISILPQSTSGTYNFNLPITIGTSGQALISNGNSAPMSWVTLTTGTVTSVAITVPSFLTLTGSPITSSGTIGISYSGTPLPVANGGTGTTTSTGTGNVVLSNSPTFVTPVLGVASATSLTASGNISGNTLTSTVATGTSPLTITSTTVVPNLNSSLLNGNTFASPGPIGSGTSSSGVFTSLSSTNLVLNGSTSGSISILPQAAAGTYNFNLPITVGTSGQVLTTQGNSSAMIWTTPTTGTVTSIDLSVPSFLNISNSPITTNGTITIGFSGTALPVANGGTGTTTSTGTGNAVLSNSPVLVTPTLGVASASSLAASGNVSGSTLTSTVAIGTAPLTITSTTVVSNLNSNFLNGNTFASPGPIGYTTASEGIFTQLNLNGSTSGTISILPQAASGTYNFNLPTTAGTSGQALISNGNSTAMSWTNLITSIALTVPGFLSVSNSPLIANGTIGISYSGTALPVANGGTGTTTSTGTGNVVLSNSPTLVTPTLGVASATSISASGNISGSTLTSTVATGTSPLTITSTTLVSNLNSNFLNGNTFASPGPIGSTTASTVSGTTITASTALAVIGTNSNTISLKGPSTGSSYNLTLPTALPASTGMALTSDTSGNLSFSTVSGGSPSYTTFSGANNVSSPANITGFAYSSGFFVVYMVVSVVATTNLTQLFQLNGVYGNNWNFFSSRLTGDETGVTFTLTSGGQLQYTDNTYPGFVSITFNWIVSATHT